MTRATWFVVADGARARVFSQEPGSDTLASALPQDLIGSRQPTRELVTDRSGQALERHGPGGHAMNKSQDAKVHGQEVLAREVAAAIRGGRNDGSFDRLVLVAPPAFLGRLRAVLDSSSSELVVASHAKDLSKLSLHDLSERLRELAP